MKTAKQDHEIMSILKVNEISRIICDTNMGTLKLRIRKGESQYQFILDAVELPKNLNKELFELLYPITPLIPQVNQTFTPLRSPADAPKVLDELLNMPQTKKPRGRPKKSNV